jgi:DNA-binding NtrC family response regulator
MNSELKKILVIDDQIGVKESHSYKNFMDNYKHLDYEFSFATAEEISGHYSVSSALAAIESESDVALVILDIRFGPDTPRLGIDILSEAVPRHPKIPFIMMTSLERESTIVVKCLRLGAKDYITKGATPEAFAETVEKYARPVTESFPILGNSKKFKEFRQIIGKAAEDSSISILISGERGTGKELVARAIHYLGSRRHAPFIPVNCAAFADHLLAAELFGAEKGTLAGINRTKFGYFEIANGGVFFLEEISEMSSTVQETLLQVLETKRFRRLGASKEDLPVDFQLICATKGDLNEIVKQGKFRADLYDRIKEIEIHTPPLRECTEDIEILAHYWLNEICRAEGGTSYYLKGFTPEVLEHFRKYHWPGNVRDLKNVIENAMIRSTGVMIDVEDLPSEVVRQ